MEKSLKSIFRIGVIILILILSFTQSALSQDNTTNTENKDNTWNSGSNFHMELELGSNWNYYLFYGSFGGKIGLHFFINDWFGLGISIAPAYAGGAGGYGFSMPLLLSIQFDAPIVKIKNFEMYMPFIIEGGWDITVSFPCLTIYSGFKFYFAKYIGLKLLFGTGGLTRYSVNLSLMIRFGYPEDKPKYENRRRIK